jgi:hypothetical protein
MTDKPMTRIEREALQWEGIDDRDQIKRMRWQDTRQAGDRDRQRDRRHHLE